MEHVSRRAFLSGASAIAISAISSSCSEAGLHLHGSGVSANNGSAVINAGQGQFAYLNIAKNFQLSSAQVGWPGILDANQYPNSGAITSNFTNVLSLDSTYFGRYLVYWTGTGNLQLSPQTIVYAGGASVVNVNPSASGSVPFNLTVESALSNPVSVEFAFGALISAIANNGSGFVRLTSSLSNAFGNTSVCDTYQTNNITNLPAGATYTVTATNNTNTIDLNVAYNGTMAVVGGSPGTASEAILSQSNITWIIFGTPSGWSNLVWCKKADNADILAGRLASSAFVN